MGFTAISSSLEPIQYAISQSGEVNIEGVRNYYIIFFQGTNCHGIGNTENITEAETEYHIGYKVHTLDSAPMERI